MEHQDGSFEGAAGHSIYYQTWTPETPPKAVVLIVHGAGEHSARYASLAQHCCAHDYAVAAIDHIGHGKSDGTYGHMESLQHHLDTLAIFRDRVAEAFPGLPMVLLGHSMGGLISACFLLEHQNKFAGCALSGPAIKTDLEPGFFQTLTIRLLSRLAPKLGVLQLDPAGVSRDTEVVRAYCEDPLINHGKMSARFVSELFKGMRQIQERAGEITLPLLVMHGEADVMTAPGGSRFIHDAARSEDKTLKLYPGLYHEIFNEPERDQVYADLIEWCDRRVIVAQDA
ncbi:alpha/beta hydrolase [Pseudohalioglobus lutimaris]|uniref:Monoacylglycerol lipase n=1 Tax=Pseudohalioglobus lutimaris TaxID=1737061 RepID=A0A2N5X8S3_9GAMM|nr:alpha/beta hydrolase [Pseudohalioglobus lutimaris]PLW70900.1 alpha/beta hydrolase [Pseudohalioglobus lutimaris]